MEDGFTTPQAAKISDLPYSTLDYWDRARFLKPSLKKASGPGSARLYSFRDLVALRVAKKLRDAGISLQAIRRVVKCLQKSKALENPAEALAESYLLTDGRHVYERQGDGLVDVLRHQGQGLLFHVIDLTSSVQEVQEKVKALRKAA